MPNLLSLRKISESFTTQVANFFCQNSEILLLDVQKKMLDYGRKMSLHAKFVEFEEDFRKLHYSGGQFFFLNPEILLLDVQKHFFGLRAKNDIVFMPNLLSLRKISEYCTTQVANFVSPESWNIAPRCSKTLFLDYGQKNSLFSFQICWVWGGFQKVALLRWPIFFARILKYCS